MTTDMMNFRDFVEKAPDADLLREMIGFAAERLAVIIAIGVNTDGCREVLGLEIGTSEAEPIWTELPHAS